MKGLTKAEFQDLVLSVGTHKSDRPLSPCEVALLLEKSLSAGEPVAECASTLGIGTTTIRTFRSLLDIAPEVRHLAGWRGSKETTIPFSTLSELVRLSVPDQREVVRAILQHQMNWKEIRQVVQIKIRSGSRVVDCITDVLQLRPKVETRYIFVGSVTSSEVMKTIDSYSQRKRDALMRRSLNVIFGNGYSVGARLGAMDFTILSDQDLGGLLGLGPDELEGLINQNLEQQIGLSD